MKHIIKNNYWDLQKEYNIDKILYLLIDRPNHIDSSNNFYWKNKKGQYHRDYDLPYFISINSHTVWRQNDLLHRDYDLSSYIVNNGYKLYYLNGYLIKSEN